MSHMLRPSPAGASEKYSTPITQPEPALNGEPASKVAAPRDHTQSIRTSEPLTLPSRRALPRTAHPSVRARDPRSSPANGFHRRGACSNTVYSKVYGPIMALWRRVTATLCPFLWKINQSDRPLLLSARRFVSASLVLDERIQVAALLLNVFMFFFSGI